MTRPGAVCVVGSLNVDRFIGLARLPEPGETLLGESLGTFPGGKGLNQAVAAARCGAPVRMVGAVGDDADAALLREAMRSAGVDAEHVVTVDAPTGVAHVTLLPGAENSIIVVPGANVALTPDDAVAPLEGAAVVLVQLEVDPGVVRSTLATAARTPGVVTVLNAAPVHADVCAMLDDVDILVVNETEAAALGGVEALAERTTVIHTRGAAGLTVHRRGHARCEVPAVAVDAVDTTGAGDAFCGGLVAGIARGLSLDEAVREGAAAGAIVASHRGAQPDALSREMVRRLRQSPSPAN
ncbi:ribokinase [Microbacterium sp. SSW1-59]|uniref:ribokinase n=1 Tax=Microbacterium xanthum TaxID=3079794 RepID=UPI002AD354D6|nr:ribokinase [Microbacterium sp. SSW1-59]MDZ8200490.1 ribokinase [Microbacterium sp. SSW1-59]